MRQARFATCAAILLLLTAQAWASSVLGLSIEDQARLSRLVVTGEVVAQRGVVDPENGVETAVALRVTEVFKGNVRPGDEIVFHTRSGEVDGLISDAVGEARLHVGQEILVFIEDIDGRLYNLGLSMGVWNVQLDRGGRAHFARALEEGLDVVGDVEVETGPVTITDMARRVDAAVRQPAFDHPLLQLRLAPDTQGRR